MYGRPGPFPEAAFIPHTRAELPGLAIFETPGHARHHLSFRLGDAMFAGEAGGCPLFFQGRVCNRPSTPPPFFAADAFESVDVLLREKDEKAYFGHTHDILPFRETLEQYRAQLRFWIGFLKSPDAAPQKGEGRRAYLSRLTEFFFLEDPDLSPLAALPPPQLTYEKFFINNSIEGILKGFGDETRAMLAGMPE
jgi:glyoxylase-like metal-dependent hydrolase (beta-lactamase superfamily II)